MSSNSRADMQDRAYEAGKRAMDLVLGGALLLLLALPMLVIAVLVRLSSRGPVLFRQERVGRNNRVFRIYKFRTMAERAEHNGPLITARDDDRVTRVGKWLRCLKIDEFPQLINVVLGDMSLVGPRPQVVRFVERFPSNLRDRVLAVRPGITGPTQIQFRHEEEMLAGQPNPEQYYFDVLLPIKCQLDAEYVQRRSLTFDAMVVLHTAGMFVRSIFLRVRRRVTQHPTHAIVVPRVPHHDDEKVDVTA